MRLQGVKLEPLDLELPRRDKLFISCWRETPSEVVSMRVRSACSNSYYSEYQNAPPIFPNLDDVLLGKMDARGFIPVGREHVLYDRQYL